MSKLLKHFCAILFLFFSVASFSQSKFHPGYIIDWNNDTTYGEIKNKNFAENATSCEFRAHSKVQSTKYLPDDIKAYRFIDGKFYVSRNINSESNKNNFLEFLVEGAFNGYFFQETSKESHYYIEKDGKLIELKSGLFRFKREVDEDDETNEEQKEYLTQRKWYKGTLNVMLDDWDNISEYTYKMDLNHNSLIDLGVQYSEFKCTDCVVYKKKTSPFFSHFGVSLDYRSTNFYMKTGDAIGNVLEHHSSTSPIVFGIYTKIPLSLLNEKASILSEFELEFAEYKFSSKELNYDSTDIHIKYTAFSLPSFSLQYSFTDGKISPFIRPKVSYSIMKVAEQSIKNYKDDLIFINSVKQPDIKGKLNASIAIGISFSNSKREIGAIEFYAGYGQFINYHKIYEHYLGGKLLVNLF